MTLDRLQYSMDEAARLLSMSRRSLERMAADGELKTIKPRGRRFVPASELERLSKLRQEPTPAASAVAESVAGAA